LSFVVFGGNHFFIQNHSIDMYIRKLFVFLYIIGALYAPVFAQVTEQPKVEEKSVNDVIIKRVELTDQYTIIYLQFNNVEKPSGEWSYPDFNLGNSLNQIWLDKETRLYKPGEIDKKFKLIRAENITTNGRQKVRPGEQVNFVAFFERLTPGIEVFDFYEGRSAKGEVSWNFFGVHIKNPEKKSTSQSIKKEDKVIPKKETQAVATAAKPAFNLLQGTIYDAKTKKPIPAQIFYVEKADTLEVKTSSGKYRIGVLSDIDYEFQILSPGYYTQKISLNPSEFSSTEAKDFYLQPLQVGEKISLPNIYFETSKSVPLNESLDELQQLTDMLRQNPNIHIRVEGHTDHVGDADKNLQLSEDRAMAVRQYLIDQGIEAHRIEAKGFGSIHLLNKSTQESELLKNRRVEFVITKE
jgi:OOP family OmpA-OmpF porin